MSPIANYSVYRTALFQRITSKWRSLTSVTRHHFSYSHIHHFFSYKRFEKATCTRKHAIYYSNYWTRSLKSTQWTLTISLKQNTPHSSKHHYAKYPNFQCTKLESQTSRSPSAKEEVDVLAIWSNTWGNSVWVCCGWRTPPTALKPVPTLPR
jgi:hypothetical protein